ncbi:hypothetical protein DdX_19940 [Ditylenchus destructor]|uniref:Peptidase M12B domain-containing protein n=1 Tax=Ditylenchus destructor TaxID=166010 RepID=A0AAD4MH52_9BILA|nr:hypothetical protein DdX_19940 [Ditylenchus destructor]
MRKYSFHSLISILYTAATIHLLKVNAQINTYRASAELLKEWRGADQYATFNGIWDTDTPTQCSYSRNIGHWIRAKRANETIKRKTSDLSLNAMNIPNDNHNFVGTHECDVLIVMDPNFKTQALNRYQSTHPKETPTDLEAKLNAFGLPENLAESWSHEQKVLQAYMYETFMEVNRIYARTDFGGVRLKMTPIVMLLDNYCAGNTRSRTLLCGDEIFHHEQKIKALNTLAAIPEIGESKHCLILFLASRSQCLNHPDADGVLKRILMNQSSARTELAEIMRTRARIPTLADHNYRGGVCDTKNYTEDKELNLKRHNIALVENHGINEDEILDNDILHDVIIYRMLTHVIGHNIGANHDHYYDKDQCYEPNLVSIMHERIHRIGAMEFYKTTEQFAKCARQYVSQHLRRLLVGHTSKGKSCLKTWLSPIGVEYVNDVWSNNPTKVRLHSISIELNGAKPITIQELRENLKNNASLIEEIRKGLGKNLGLNFSGDMQFIKPDGKEGPPCKGHVIRCLEDAGHRVNAIDADHPPVLVIYAPKKIKTD